MSPLSVRLIGTLLVTLLISPVAHSQSDSRSPREDVNGLRAMDLSELEMRLPVSRGVDAYAKSTTDSFYLYGGPGSFEGTFERPDGGPDPQGWTSQDLTEVSPIWRGSSTNASSTGDGNPAGFTGMAGNNAAISHHDGLDYVGYGNNWNDWLVFTYDLAAVDPFFDPETTTTDVRFTCEYKHYIEDDYDFLLFEWNRGGAYQQLYAATGNSFNFDTGNYEKRDFDSDLHGGISYEPGDYVDGTSVQLRIRVTSDPGWSDEDGDFSSNGRGAAAIDNILVYVNEDPVSQADFEPAIPVPVDLPEGDFSGLNLGAASGTSGWVPVASDFVGDFSKLSWGFQDIDPCVENRSWQYSFIDDGTPPKNDPQQRSTGGSISPTWSYGIYGGWVINYEGGLTYGANTLHNAILSPEIDFDLPGTGDDGAWGCVIGADTWSHLPLSNRIFTTLEMRSYDGETWSGWDAEWVWFSFTAVYFSFQIDVTNLLGPSPEKVQLRAGVWHLEHSGVPDATPSPLFDNFWVKKYVLPGPMVRVPGGFHTPIYDHFPTDGTADGSIRWDKFTGWEDSMTIEILPVNRGTQLADPDHGGTMHVALLANPEFGDHLSGGRAAALQQLGAVLAGQDSRAWPIYTFAVQGQVSTHSDGTPVEDTYFFDLPDGPALPDFPHLQDEDPLLFRGDVVHYYIEALDNAGGRGLLPADITGFLNFEPGSLYSGLWTVRCFPGGSGGAVPKMLVWDKRPPQPQLRRLAFAQAGFVEGRDFDYYGGRHLSGTGDLSMELASNYETIVTFESRSDSVDVQFLTDWRERPGNRRILWMARKAAEYLSAESTGTGVNFLHNVLGVDYLAPAVGDIIGGQVSAEVVPVKPCFVTSFTAANGCPLLQEYNYVAPMNGSEISHEYLDPAGNPYVPSIAAGILWPREEMAYDKTTAFFPLGLDLIWHPRESDELGDGTAVRARVLREAFQCMGINGGLAVDAGEIPLRFAVQQNVPNPFNPNTRISYTIPNREHVRMIVYDAAGRRIRSLVDGIQNPGPHFVDWDARDEAGARVASGIYHYRLQAGSFEETKRMVLLK